MRTHRRDRRRHRLPADGRRARSRGDSFGTYHEPDAGCTAGDTYQVTVYTPQPSAARSLPARAPTIRSADLTPELEMLLPVTASAGSHWRTCRRSRSSSRPTDRTSASRVTPGSPPGQALTLLRCARLTGPSTRSRSASSAAPSTPYQYVQAVMRYLSSGLHLRPRRRRRARCRSSTSCWTRKLGYCQQFAGAMALLLRMGGRAGARLRRLRDRHLRRIAACIRGERHRRACVGRGLVPAATAGSRSTPPPARQTAAGQPPSRSARARRSPVRRRRVRRPATASRAVGAVAGAHRRAASRQLVRGVDWARGRRPAGVDRRARLVESPRAAQPAPTADAPARRARARVRALRAAADAAP